MMLFPKQAPRYLLTAGGERTAPVVRTLPAAAMPAPAAIPVAAYCRVSTLDASQEDSLEMQTEHWKAYILSRPGWKLAAIYAERQSGTHAETRQALMKLISDCSEGRVSVILTKSVSRFSRNTIDCLRLVRELRAMGVSVIFEKEGIDTGSMTSELFLSLMATFAAEESRSISNNVRLGYRHRFQAGEFRYKRPPYGYDVAEGNLVVNPEEAMVVEDIFDAAVKGVKASEIAARLVRRGVSTKYNVTWQASTVTAIVSNLTYTGDALLQKTYKDEDYRGRVNDGRYDQFFIPERHEAIVSREVFVLANETMGLRNPYARIRAAEAASGDEDGKSPRRIRVIKADQQAARKRRALRVAAYCRVSTDLEEQESSYEVQCSHYHALITGHPGWTLAGIYADEGISGTSMKHRDGFNRMVADAEAGKIDLILTKSISRFARNTVDCLSVVRRLKQKEVGVTFEKEGIDTLDGQGEVILTILASIAQQESASISQNIRLGIQYRFQQGKPMVNCNRFLGYDKRQGKLVINEAQAGIVRRVYRDFLDGFSVDMIAGDLRREGVVSGGGATTWHTSSVRYILTNEKYAGDLLLQKTVVTDFLTHRMVWNRGQLPQYYVSDAHPPIIPHSVFERAAEELWLRSNYGRKGGMKFGSRTALMGRTVCGCGGRMKRLKRIEPVFVCEGCGKAAAERSVKRQVMDAIASLPAMWDRVERLIEENRAALDGGDHLARALAKRREWYLGNLLNYELTVFDAACRDESDFRARTLRRISAWNDDSIVRILERVVVGEKVVFKGGLEV